MKVICSSALSHFKMTHQAHQPIRTRLLLISQPPFRFTRAFPVMDYFINFNRTVIRVIQRTHPKLKSSCLVIPGDDKMARNPMRPLINTITSRQPILVVNSDVKKVILVSTPFSRFSTRQFLDRPQITFGLTH